MFILTLAKFKADKIWKTGCYMKLKCFAKSWLLWYFSVWKFDHRTEYFRCIYRITLHLASSTIIFVLGLFVVVILCECEIWRSSTMFQQIYKWKSMYIVCKYCCLPLLMFVSWTCYFVCNENGCFKLLPVNFKLSLYFGKIDEIEWVICTFGARLHFWLLSSLDFIIEKISYLYQLAVSKNSLNCIHCLINTSKG